MIQGVNTLRALLLGLALALPATALPVPFEDSLAQRAMACTHCHGDQGRAGPDGYYPRLAGKPAGYLYHQLLNFRDGQRNYGLMSRLLATLSDDYLMDLARHFADQTVPYPAPTPSPQTPAQRALAQQLVRHGDPSRQLPACAQCHGAQLMGMQPATPGLLGLPRDYLNAQLGAWKTGQRRAHTPDCMAQVVQRLSDAEIHQVATWLSNQTVPPGAQVAPAPPTSTTTALPLRCGSALPAAGHATTPGARS